MRRRTEHDTPTHSRAVSTIDPGGLSAAEADQAVRTTIESVIAGFAHEVRNPLAAILSMTELAIGQLEQSGQDDEGLSRIPELVGRIERLIQEALNYSRPTEPQPMSLRSDLVARSAIRMVAARFPDAAFSLTPQAGAPLLFADRSHVERVLCNLLQNACEAGATAVDVSIHALDGMVTYRVADNAGGVPPDVVGLMFEPFYTSRARGTGLGLAIARDLSRRNDGDVELTATGPDGSVFELTAPLCMATRRAVRRPTVPVQVASVE